VHSKVHILVSLRTLWASPHWNKFSVRVDHLWGGVSFLRKLEIVSSKLLSWVTFVLSTSSNRLTEGYVLHRTKALLRKRSRDMLWRVWTVKRGTRSTILRSVPRKLGVSSGEQVRSLLHDLALLILTISLSSQTIADWYYRSATFTPHYHQHQSFLRRMKGQVERYRVKVISGNDANSRTRFTQDELDLCVWWVLFPLIALAHAHLDSSIFLVMSQSSTMNVYITKPLRDSSTYFSRNNFRSVLG